MKKWKIKVPGSTSNLGPGFDSVGLAINRYLEMEVTLSNRWEFIYHTPEFEQVPTNEENIIYKAFEFAAKTSGHDGTLPACRVEVTSELPLARGLGSSAAAIVAGIELADVLLDLSLSKSEKTRFASLYEGHPDNVAASVHGGLIIASHTAAETIVVPMGTPRVDMIIMIPTNQLMTSESRGVLPTSLSFREAIEGSSIANVMIAALLKGDVETAGKMMKLDIFHQPYRSKFVPDLERIVEIAPGIDVDGVALSGAGPSVMCYTKTGNGIKAVEKLKEAFPSYDCQLLYPAENGSVVSVLEAHYSRKTCD